MSLAAFIAGVGVGCVCGLIIGVGTERDTVRAARQRADDTRFALTIAANREKLAQGNARHWQHTAGELRQLIRQRDELIADIRNGGGPNGVWVSRRDAIRSAHYEEVCEALTAELNQIRQHPSGGTP